MRARASLFFQTLIQCLTHMNIKSIFIFTTSFFICLCVLQAKIPWCQLRLSQQGLWNGSSLWFCSLVSLFKHGVQPWRRAPKLTVQIAASVDAGLAGLQAHPVQNRVTLLRGQWLLSPLPLPGLWGKGLEALSTTWKQRGWTSTQGQLRQTCLCLQRVEENENCHWGFPRWSSS